MFINIKRRLAGVSAELTDAERADLTEQLQIHLCCYTNTRSESSDRGN